MRSTGRARSSDAARIDARSRVRRRRGSGVARRRHARTFGACAGSAVHAALSAVVDVRLERGLAAIGGVGVAIGIVRRAGVRARVLCAGRHRVRRRRTHRARGAARARVRRRRARATARVEPRLAGEPARACRAGGRPVRGRGARHVTASAVIHARQRRDALRSAEQRSGRRAAGSALEGVCRRRADRARGGTHRIAASAAGRLRKVDLAAIGGLAVAVGIAPIALLHATSARRARGRGVGHRARLARGVAAPVHRIIERDAQAVALHLSRVASGRRDGRGLRRRRQSRSGVAVGRLIAGAPRLRRLVVVDGGRRLCRLLGGAGRVVEDRITAGDAGREDQCTNENRTMAVHWRAP